ncbi:MAG TPA: flagellar biosynthesis anti-sigma factor FlgM [Acidobacteriaceae bacterium]|nr:flagellar biosynthesis anti-sigma factor FlgM [Acidobacteriaceae bacterium]
MNVTNDLQGLQQIFSTPDVAPARNGSPSSAAAAEQPENAADVATLTPAGSVAAQAAPDSDVRMDKVISVQQALAAGTYSVPAGAVADKMIDQMLGK